MVKYYITCCLSNITVEERYMVSILIRYCLGNGLYTVLAENQSLKFFVSLLLYLSRCTQMR